jgi:hypothetical protein
MIAYNRALIVRAKVIVTVQVVCRGCEIWSWHQYNRSDGHSFIITEFDCTCYDQTACKP